jgi:hypothetical protein
MKCNEEYLSGRFSQINQRVRCRHTKSGSAKIPRHKISFFDNTFSKQFSVSQNFYITLRPSRTSNSLTNKWKIIPAARVCGVLHTAKLRRQKGAVYENVEGLNFALG